MLVYQELGYLPLQLRSIAARDEEGRPLVLQVHPLGGHSRRARRNISSLGTEVEPFPTMYWLTSKALCSRVSDLERLGGVMKLYRRLDESPPEVQELQREAHRNYASTRWALLSDEEKELAEKHGWTKRLRDGGIAGITDFNCTVKCLHTHYGHFLALKQSCTDVQNVRNIVGEWVDQLLQEDDGGK